MAQQLNLLKTGQIIPTPLHREMQKSYLEYAMSVIVGRALPDVRDGLKPVHRRILYAMYELGLTPDRPFRKCARVVGDVLGKYHPHGDQAVYDALVRMVQDFSSRYPLLAGHGNFGSVDNDPPAAMRYTETRLAAIAYESILREIDQATVNFTDNFDSSQQEPVVLPSQLPILLLNGCTGIAVGMATNIPPHNLSEVVDGLIALIDKPELTAEKLGQIIPGPDFPTGGEIIETAGVKQVYQTGRGLIPLRGVAKIEKIQIGKRRRKEGMAIIITELPYQVNKAGWIEKVADLVNQGRLEGIADLRDESDRQGMRIVVELKRDAKPKTVLAALYQHTPLQINFGAIMLALVNNSPSQLPLRELLNEFLKFREETLTRQYSHELKQAEHRSHLLEGLLTALNNLDTVIDILRNAADGSTAKLNLVEQLQLSESQADSILAMPLRRLTGLERQKLEQEYQELQTRIAQLQTLLSDRHELMKALKKELRGLKRKFGDPRRTRIISASSPLPQPQEKAKAKPQPTPAKASVQTELPVKSSPTPPEDAVIALSYHGYISWQSAAVVNKIPSSLKPGEDCLIYRQKIAQRQQLVIITDTGKAYPLAIADLPEPAKARPILSLLPNSAQRDSESVVAYFFLPEGQKCPDLLLLTTQGRIKRLSLRELNNLTNRGLALIKLKAGDRLGYVRLISEGEEAAIATNSGRVLRFQIDEQQLPIMGRSAQGSQALRLRYHEQIVGCVSANSSQDLLLISQLGYGKSIPIRTLRLAHLGDLGNVAFHFAQAEDSLATMELAEAANLILWTNQKRGKSLSVEKVPLLGKDGAGEVLAKLKSEERIVTINLI